MRLRTPARMQRVDPRTLKAMLADAAELALVDLREELIFSQSHLLFARSVPLSRLELRFARLVPRRATRIVLIDDADGLAQRAADVLARAGYSNLAYLDGGVAAWATAGFELFSGVHVPSKAFGEFIEHHYGTPRIAPGELKRLQQLKKVLVVDSRPFEEYHRMNIPGGIDVPGAELVYRIHDLAPSPDTLVVVNCAGRTRSIIGCQSLRNAGIPNPVVALKDGTMGWELAGFTVERGAERVAPAPSEEGREKALAAAERVAKRFSVGFCSSQDLSAFRRDSGRTLYILDVRTREEFERSHVTGSRHAPGGQLVQASDEYVGVRNARVVLVDPDLVRAIMTASWLNQMGWNDVYVLEDPELTESGPRKPRIPGTPPWRTVRAIPEGAQVLDLSTSLRFHHRHIPGAWWG
ncbi:MAG: rhodanese-like domain-containing protein, partial [Burkholderiales bacterium]